MYLYSIYNILYIICSVQYVNLKTSTYSKLTDSGTCFGFPFEGSTFLFMQSDLLCVHSGLRYLESHVPRLARRQNVHGGGW